MDEPPVRDGLLPPGQKRIGDTERRAVDERLQHAVGDGVLTLSEYEERASQVWGARTQGELAPIIEDLPDPHAQVAPTDPGPLPSRTRWGVAVMGGHDVRGPFSPGERIRVLAVMGGGSVDLRRGDLPAVIDVQVAAVMGGVEIFVPVGARVERRGFALMGGVEQTAEPGRPDAPLVRVTAHALMGGVAIGHGPTDKRVDAGTPAAGTAMATTSAGTAPNGRQRGAVRHGPAPRRGGVLARRVAGLAVIGALAAGAGYAVSQAEAVAVFGNQTVPVMPAAGETREVNVGSVFGNVSVVVPDGATVRKGGFVVFGNQDCEACEIAPPVAPPPGSPGPPMVRVTGYGAFSNVEVLTESQAAEEEAADHDND